MRRDTDYIDVMVEMSWPAPQRTIDMDTDNWHNAIAIVTTAWGGQMVRAFEGRTLMFALFKLTEAVAYWSEHSQRPIEIRSIKVQNADLSPHQLWNLITMFCEKHLSRDEPNKRWELKPHVDAFAANWNARADAEATAARIEAGRGA